VDLTDSITSVLVVGATGSIGRHVVAAAPSQGLQVRALALNTDVPSGCCRTPSAPAVRRKRHSSGRNLLLQTPHKM
jgi:hypothetical protein